MFFLSKNTTKSSHKKLKWILKRVQEGHKIIRQNQWFSNILLIIMKYNTKDHIRTSKIPYGSAKNKMF